MRSAVFVVPGSIDTRTGGSIYDRRMVEGLRRLGWTVTVVELDASFPRPTPGALAHASRALAAIAAGETVVVDGLAFGAMPDLVEREAARLRLVALVHLPLAADVGLDAAEAARLRASERRALAAAAMVVVTGAATLSMLEGYGLPRDTVLVVEPGTDPAPVARGSSGPPARLLSVATLNPGKGHDILLRALASVPRDAWRLTCAGSLTRHPATAIRVQDAARDLGLEHCVSFAGELGAAALETCYDAADVFVLATLQETYGMAVAEALAHGLPVVSTTTGVIPTLVGRDAGLLVPPGDVGALSEALSRVIADAALRARLALGARRVRETLPTWQHAAAAMAAALEGAGTHV